MLKKPIIVLTLLLTAMMLSSCELFDAGGRSEKPLAVSAESLSISTASMELAVGESGKIDAVVRPEDTTELPDFFSMNESVATVDKKGNVTAVGEGKADIAVTCGILRSTCHVTVTNPEISSIEFSEGSISLELGDSVQPEIRFYPENAEPGSYRFTSDDERIATVDPDGTITAVGMGNTCITAILEEDDTVRCMLDLTTTCERLLSMRFEERYYAVTKDEEKMLSLVMEPFGICTQGISWSSSDESVVSVDAEGTVTGRDYGAATITAECDDVRAVCTVVVSKRLAPDPIDEIGDGRYTETDGVLHREGGDDSGKAHLMLVGDLMCLSSQQNAARSGGVSNFNSSFSLVRNLFAKSDFCIGNLETLTSASHSYAAESKEVNGNPNCNAPATYLDALKYAGLDAVVTANNHCLDGGETGVIETLQQLSKYRIPNTGLFPSKEEQRFLIADVNGIKVGIAAYTKHFNNGRSMPADQRGIMTNLYDQEKVKQDVRAMKEAGAEYIIAYMHWGTENTHQVDSLQKKYAQELADAGVDLIAGSHPHCLQHAATVTAADGREVFCIYSMGNFVSSMGSTINNDTIILNVELERRGDRIELADTGYIGCRVIGSYDGGRYVIVPISPELNGGSSTSALQGAGSRIADVMGDTLKEITTLP